MDSKGKTLPLVKLQYKFKKKKGRDLVRTSMKAFSNNPDNRLNHMNSYKLGLGAEADVVTDVVLKEKIVELNVKKSKTFLHVDGITFVPTIGGIVVGLAT